MTVDLPFVLTFIGVAVVAVGAYLLTPALALVVVGAVLVGVAWAVANRPPTEPTP